jgi:hypothetical protein
MRGNTRGRSALRSGLVAAVVSAAVIAAPVATAVPADPAATLVASITSTFDPATPGGKQGSWYAGNSSTGAPILTTAHLRVGAVGGPAANGFSLDLYPPAGQVLHAGYYAGVQTGWGGQSGHANVAFSYGRAIENYQGDVEIRDFAATADGTVTRFALLFHLRTEAVADNLFGEIRLGEPEPSGHVLSARAVDWPRLPVGSPPAWSTEWLHNTSDHREGVGQAAFAGGSTGDFRLANDTCSGTSLAAGNSCSVRIGFTPRRAGPRGSILTFPIDGQLDTVQLTGSAPAGSSSLVTFGPDYIDSNQRWRYVDGPDQISAGFHSGFLGFGESRIYDPGFDSEVMWLTVPRGHTFTLGTHLTRSANDLNRYGLSVYGHGRGCGSYSGKIDIKQLLLASDGNPIRADITFTQICDEAPAVHMTGELRWRLAPDITPPPPITQLRVTSTRTVTWTAPRVADFSYTRVRVTTGAVDPRAVAAAGYLVYIGPGQTARLPALTPGLRYILSARTVDTTGNLSAASWTTFTG